MNVVFLVEYFIKVMNVQDVKRNFIENVLRNSHLVFNEVIIRSIEIFFDEFVFFLPSASLERIRSFDRGSIELPRAFASNGNNQSMKH